MEEFIKDRNEALTSLDENKIRAYCLKYNIEMPKTADETFWAGVHKAICQLFLLKDTPVSVKQFNESHNWLIKHGYDPSLK